MRRLSLIFILSVSTFHFFARASTLSLPQSLTREALSESMPSAFAPGELTVKDFSWSWLSGSPPADVIVKWIPHSLEWVRVGEVLVIPRARLYIQLQGYKHAQVHYMGMSFPFNRLATQGMYIDLPVVLLENERDTIEVSFEKENEKIQKHRLKIQFHPNEENRKEFIFYDPSCSAYQAHAKIEKSSEPFWIYVGCRLIQSQGYGYRSGQLETYWLLSRADPEIKVDEVESNPIQDNLWVFRTKSSSSPTSIQSPLFSIQFTHTAPTRLKYGSLGVGLGPYNYQQESPGTSIQGWTPLLTIYLSHVLTETVRIVAFNATNIQKSWVTDLGAYIYTETARVLDRRVSLNLMLGAHLIGFKAFNQNQTKFSAPQGVELIYRDFLQKNYNLVSGAFLYPPIAHRSYYNLWLRWGKSGYFAEINYIGIQEPLELGQRFYSRSFGVSLGMPLFKY